MEELLADPVVQYYVNLPMAGCVQEQETDDSHKIWYLKWSVRWFITYTDIASIVFGHVKHEILHMFWRAGAMRIILLIEF